MTCNLIKPKRISEFLYEIQIIYLQKNKYSVFYYLKEMLYLTQNNNTILKHVNYTCSKEANNKKIYICKRKCICVCFKKKRRK